MLVTHPEIQDILRGDERKISAFGEEVLRYLAPVTFRGRVATTDVELGGQLIRAVARFLPVNASANRDPHQFAEPGDADLAMTALVNESRSQGEEQGGAVFMSSLWGTIPTRSQPGSTPMMEPAVMAITKDFFAAERRSVVGL